MKQKYYIYRLLRMKLNMDLKINLHKIFTIHLSRLILLLVLLLGFTGKNYSQFFDDFVDGDFTSGVLWSGNTSKFIVNNSAQLQLNSAGTDTAYLYTPSSAFIDTEWNFWMRLAFAPSNNNFVKVYLMSDQQNLNGPLNGYFVRYGEDLSNDNLELWKQSGITATKIIDGITNPGAAGTNQQIRVKVTRSAAGVFELWGDYSGGVAYQQMGSVTDNTVLSTSNFGLWTKFTSSNATKVYFDNIYAGPIIVDTQKPAVLNVVINSNDSLTVKFTEPIQSAEANSTANYLLSPGGSPSSATLSSNFTDAGIKLSTSLQSGNTYSLLVKAMKDFVGNVMNDTIILFTYYEPAFNDIIFNEIMADPYPVVALPNAEYVELHNRKPFPVNIDGWKLKAGSTTKTLTYAVIPADSFLVITDAEIVNQFAGNVLGIVSFPLLSNAGTTLSLLAPNGTLINSVSYKDSWYGDPTKKDGGWSLELANPNDVCGGINNWRASMDEYGGTPGRKNSVYLNINVPFKVKGITARNVNTVEVAFNKQIDTTTVFPGLIEINGNQGWVSSIKYLTTDSIRLNLNNTLIPNTIYNLNILPGVKDCSGGALNMASPLEFLLFNASIFDIVINEILADETPQVGLPALEFVELYNRTPYPVDLQGWEIATSTTAKIIDYGILQPDSFIVLAKPEGINLFQDISLAPVTSFPGITNTGTTLTLRDRNKNLIHSITYTDAWYGESGKKNGGWTIEMIDPNNPCGGKENWAASVNSKGGTPGFRNSNLRQNANSTAPRPIFAGVLASDTLFIYFNKKINKNTITVSRFTIDNQQGVPLFASIIEPDWDKVILKLSSPMQENTNYTLTVSDSVTDCAGNPSSVTASLKFMLPKQVVVNDIIINEVLNNPTSTGVDYVEIFNRSANALDLNGFKVTKYDTVLNAFANVYEITNRSLLLMPGDYLLLSKDQTVVKKEYKAEYPYSFWDMSSMVDIANAGGTIALTDKSFTIIDRFTFDESFHFALIKDLDGVALERINYNRPTQDKTNWNSAASAVGYGTPGYRNSQFMMEKPADDEISLDPEIFSPDNDGYNDVLNINYKFDAPGYMISFSIFDDVGRLTRKLISSQLAGTEGTVTWNGITDTNDRARVGIYILLVEIMDLQGKKKSYKKPLVVATRL